jgi:hypothetical protein
MNAVNITVTNRQIGTGPVVPTATETAFKSTLQGNKSGRPVVYTVPIYELKIEAAGTYPVIRFGLHNRGDNAAPQVRPCDSGLHQTRVCAPSWLPNYSPHSFRDSSRVGAWQLLPGKGLLIHEGRTDPQGRWAAVSVVSRFWMVVGMPSSARLRSYLVESATR